MRQVGRRDFILTSSGWLGSMMAAKAVADRRAKTVSILHTTDLHGHIRPTMTYQGVGDVGGLARCATQIRRWRREFPDSLLVDIGDVYQGTPVGLQTDGQIMMELFNRLGYDAWAIGNHDFDWGREILEKALNHSRATVLTGNLKVDGRLIGEADGPWKRVKPWTIRELAGFRIGMVGLTTPGLPFWLAPETLAGVSVSDPAEVLKRSIAELRAAGADAIVVMGHMGWRSQEDYANPVQSLLKAAEGVDVYLAGHSHQDQPMWLQGGTLCSQAGYHGIHCGRVDLTFDLESRKLIDRKAFTVRMDDRFELDPLVMEISGADLETADERMARKVITVTRNIPITGRDSLLTIFCRSFQDALAKAGTPVDLIYHGTFNTGDVTPGEKTVADCWDWLPYENLLVTAELTPEEMVLILEEEKQSRYSDRVIWPLEIVEGPSGAIRELRLDGKTLPSGKRFKVALNSYDAQSGGKSMMALREILQHPESRRKMTGISTRAALIDWMLEREKL